MRNVLATICSFKAYVIGITKEYATWKSLKFNKDLGILNIISEGDVIEMMKKDNLRVDMNN